MAKYDEQLNRMMSLMNYDNSLNESKKTNNGIEYHITAADGREYGIIKEGRYYYLKTTTPEKKNISESYDYLNGFNRRGETRYNSYNEATKQLELRIMSINESYGKHEDISIANLNKTQEAMSILTEDTRKELDRMHTIFENSFISKDNIGNHGNPEGKGSATGANTIKNNAPFEDKAEAKLDKDMKETGTVEGATSDHTKVGDADKKLQNADKMEKGKRGDEEYKDTHDDLEGEGVADKKPSGAKSVKMNESFEKPEDWQDTEFEGTFTDEDEGVYMPDDYEARADRYEEEQGLLGDEANDEAWKEFEADFVDSHNVPYEETEEIVGTDEDEDDLDALLREFLDGPTFNNSAEGSSTASNSDSGSNGPLEEVFDVNVAPDLNIPAAVGKADVMQEEEKIVGPDEVLDGPHGSGNSVHSEETMDKIDETIERITDMVMEALCKEEKKCKCGKKNCTCKDGECKCKEEKNMKTLQEAIDRMVKEEVTKLDVWGKHPRYRKEPMTTPANKEVLAGTAEKDWNDESAKGEQPYGQKIGSSAPFDKAVDALTNKVFEAVIKTLKVGK